MDKSRHFCIVLGYPKNAKMRLSAEHTHTTTIRLKNGTLIILEGFMESLGRFVRAGIREKWGFCGRIHQQKIEARATPQFYFCFGAYIRVFVFVYS